MEMTLEIQGSDGSVLTIEATSLLLDRVCQDYMLDDHDQVTDDHLKNFVLTKLMLARRVDFDAGQETD